MKALIQFLKSHDCTVAAYAVTGGIRVAGEVSDRSGRISITVTTIPATLSACRDWLGY